MITVVFFASLREAMDSAGCTVSDASTVAEVWDRATAASPIPPSILCAINGQLSSWQAEVSPGDEVAFFPPMTGG